MLSAAIVRPGTGSSAFRLRYCSQNRKLFDHPAWIRQEISSAGLLSAYRADHGLEVGDVILDVGGKVASNAGAVD
jgi:hypothetical protein